MIVNQIIYSKLSSVSEGFYDIKEGRHYQYIRNRQGSTMAVVNDAGDVVQRTGYYASGTPFVLPVDSSDGVVAPLDSVSDRLHIGNRWLDLAGLAMYDNTARVHDPLVPHMLTCDSRAVDYPGHSPFSHCAGNPANLVDMDGNQVFAVHGTFSEQDTWENQDDIMAFCKDRFGDTMFYFKFEWSGGNSRYARTEAANKLIAEILTKREGVDPSEPITLVGHSHGGNVIIEAANKMVNMKEFEGITINLLTICTPVRDDYQPSQALQDRGEHINVYDDIDPVQVMGGADMKFIITSDPTAYGNTEVKVPFELGQADRMFKNAKNIGVKNESIFKNFHNSHNKVNDWKIKRKKK